MCYNFLRTFTTSFKLLGMIGVLVIYINSFGIWN